MYAGADGRLQRHRLQLHHQLDAKCSTEGNRRRDAVLVHDNDGYDNEANGLVGSDDAGKILVQGPLLAIAGVVQGLMTTEVVTSFVKTPSIPWA